MIVHMLRDRPAEDRVLPRLELLPERASPEATTHHYRKSHMHAHTNAHARAHACDARAPWTAGRSGQHLIESIQVAGMPKLIQEFWGYEDGSGGTRSGAEEGAGECVEEVSCLGDFRDEVEE